MTSAPHSIGRRIGTLRGTARIALLLGGIGRLLLLALLFLGTTLALDLAFELERGYRLGLLVLGAAALVWTFKKHLVLPLAFRVTDDDLALALERSHPSLRQALVSALQFSRRLAQPGGPGGESEALMRRTVAGGEEAAAATRALAGLGWSRVRTHLLLLLATAVTLGGSWALAPATLDTWFRRQVLLADVAWPRYTTLTVLGTRDGVLYAPRGEDLPVFIRASGRIPSSGRIRWSSPAGDAHTEPLARVGRDRFRHLFDTVSRPLEFTARAGDGRVGPVPVRPVDRPVTSRLRLRVTEPAYTGRPPREEDLLAGEGLVQVLAGSRLRLTGTMDKAITTVAAQAGRDLLPGSVVAGDPRSFTLDLEPRRTLTLALVPRDRFGLAPNPPVRLTIQVVPDRPPTLTLAPTGVGALVSSRVRIPLTCKAADDVALTRLELQQGVGDGENKPVMGPARARGAEDFQAGEADYIGEWTWTPGTLKLAPGLTLYLAATCTDRFGPGEPHRTTTPHLRFKVVQDEILLKDLLRRQGEIRAELEAVEEAVRALREDLAARPEPEGRLPRTLHGYVMQVTGSARRMDQVLMEWDNNRLPGAAKVLSLRHTVVDPLLNRAVPALSTARELTVSVLAGQAEATRRILPALDRALDTLKRVLKAMARLEDFQRVVEITRSLLRTQGEARMALKKKLERALEDLFGGEKDK